MLWTIIIILFCLWLFSVVAGGFVDNRPYGGNWIHTLVILAVVLLILHLVGLI